MQKNSFGPGNVERFFGVASNGPIKNATRLFYGLDSFALAQTQLTQSPFYFSDTSPAGLNCSRALPSSGTPSAARRTTSVSQRTSRPSRNGRVEGAGRCFARVCQQLGAAAPRPHSARPPSAGASQRKAETGNALLILFSRSRASQDNLGSTLLLRTLLAVVSTVPPMLTFAVDKARFCYARIQKLSCAARGNACHGVP